MQKKYFENAEDFQNYVKEHKPQEIWLDDFSETKPYLSGLKYFFLKNKEMVRGSFSSQTFYVNSLENIHNSFEKGMYVKIETN